MKFSELEAAITPDKNALDDENIRQPQLIYEASKGLADANMAKAEASQAVDVTYAELDAQLRRAASEGGEKLSETQIKMKITTMPRMQKAEAAVIEAVHVATLWQGLLEAFKQRGYSLSNIGELYQANYFASEGKAQRQAKTEVADRNREAAATLRQERRGPPQRG